MIVTSIAGLPLTTDAIFHMTAIMSHTDNLPYITAESIHPTTLDTMTTRIAVDQPLHAMNATMNLVMLMNTTAPRGLGVIKVDNHI